MSTVWRINRHTFPQLYKNYRFYSISVQQQLQQENEYTSTPQYPEIMDISPEQKLERRKHAEYEALKDVKTVEEKQIKLNMSRYYGFKCYLLKENLIPYNNLNLAQHCTRTHFIESEQHLPAYYDRINIIESELNEIQTEIEEAILIELEGYRRTHDLRQQTNLDKIELENLYSSSITKQINRSIINRLSDKYPHLTASSIDFDSRIESCWYVGGMNPPEIIKKRRAGCSWLKSKENDPVDRIINYIGSAMVALRHQQPLLPIIPYSEAKNPALIVPFFQHDPRTVGIQTEHRHLANIPGFWPNDPKEFGLLSYHNRGHHQTIQMYRNREDDVKEALHRQGILASYGWLMAQANFLGFNTFNDITYPLVTQTIITNGQLWSFYVYQMNTILLHSKYMLENPKRNICWATPQLKLYETIDNGKLIGFNPDILKILLKFYANIPEERLGVNMRPYLRSNEKIIADYEDDEKRQWLEKEYKFLVANRPRMKLPTEIFAWEKIYKIDNNTRFMDKKRRPHDFGINVYKRRLDERVPTYIPRALRPDLPKNKGRYAKDYWP